MALKFRRGTTAQQSGSLAFGEPFVNTTLQTLLVGGNNGDIQLATVGTGSTANFGDISGSALNITTNIVVGGNVDGVDISVLNTNINSTTASLNTSITNLNSFSSSQLTQNSALATISGSLISSASTAKTTNDSQDVSLTNLNSFTSSINTTIKSKLNTEGVVSGSSQITLSSTTGFSTYSSSVDSRITTEKGRVDAILLAADADKDSFAEIVTLINSVDTTNDNAFASFYTASVGRLNNLESTSASLETRMSTLASYTGSNDTTNTTQNTRLTALEASASTALSTNNTQATSITNLNSTTASLLIETANLESFSSSALTRLTALEVETANLESFTSSINTTIKTRLNAETVISGSSQVNADTITNFDSNVLAYNNSLGVVSGSAQINVASTTGDIALGTRTSGNYVASLVAGTNITLSNNSGEGATPTIGLTNNTISGISLGSNLATLTIGTGLSGTSYNGSSAVTIANTGVTSNVAGTGVSVSGATGAVTISIGQAVATSSNVQFNSLGVGMAASATAGRIDATNDIVAFSSSDIRFKENIKPIENPIQKIRKISGNTYDWKEENKIEHGYEGNDVGVIAQEIEEVLPQLVQTRESGYKAVKYDKLVALLIEGIKEQQLQIEDLKLEIEALKKQKGL